MAGVSKADGNDNEKVVHLSFREVRKAVTESVIAWDDFIRGLDETMKPRKAVAEMTRGEFMPLLVTFVKRKREEKLNKYRNGGRNSSGLSGRGRAV